jgi:hypothetical protein
VPARDVPGQHEVEIDIPEDRKMNQPQAHKPVRVGVFDRIRDADRAVEMLSAAGFAPSAISVICPTCTKERWQEYERKDPAGSHAPAAAAGGGAIGALLGGLIGIAGAAATGGAALLVAGPLLTGAAGGAVAGGLIGAMSTRGGEKEVADFYDQALQRGKILVGVEVADDEDQARLETAERVLLEAGAEPIPLPRG